MVATAIASTLALAGGAYGLVAYGWATDWEHEAERRGADLAATEEELTATSDDLEDATERITDLRETVADLAAAREEVRDALAQRNDELSLSADLNVLLADIGAGMANCVDSLFSWMGSQPSTFDAAFVWNAYWDRGFSIARQCGEAVELYDTLLTR